MIHTTLPVGRNNRHAPPVRAMVNASDPATLAAIPMKKKLHRLAALTAVTCFLTPTGVLAQGALTPPGAPAPTMKTLSEIEPRRSISQADLSATGYYTITQPGSYYLTENITGSNANFFGVIWINSADVTLDLNGFTVSQTSTAGSFFVNGIYVSASAVANLTIRNGTLRGPTVWSDAGTAWGGAYSESASQGIYIKSIGSSVSVPVMKFENLTLRNWGFTGISLDYPYDGKTGRAIIANCSFIEIAQIGIRGRAAVIRDCSISKVGTQGIEGDNNVIERVMIEGAGGNGIAGNLNVVRAVNMRWIGLDGMSGAQHNIADVNVTGARSGLAVNDCVVTGSSLCNNRSHGLSGSRNAVAGTVARANAGRGFNGDSSNYQNVTATGNTSEGIGGNDVAVNGAVLSNNGLHGIVGANATVRGIKAAGNTGAGVYCDNSVITECTANTNGDDGIRGVGSVIANCRAFGNDTNAGGYVASGIVWSGGKIHNSLADTASPAIP